VERFHLCGYQMPPKGAAAGPMAQREEEVRHHLNNVHVTLLHVG
jgi:hypothetical protein